ncbi:MAG: lipopolysaccharide heptosyltransferase II [Rhodoferax sp.]
MSLPPAPVRSLVIAPQWIGDAIMAEPLLRQLHARGETLTVAALPWVAPVLRAMPCVGAVLELPFAHGGLQWGARRALGRILQGQFERAYVLPNSLKSALIPWWAEVPVRVGYQGELRWGLLTHRLPNPPKGDRPPMVAWYLRLAGLAALPGEASPAAHPPGAAGSGGAYPPSATARAGTQADDTGPSGAGAARPQLQAPDAAVLQGLDLPPAPYVVMAPGAEYGAAKRWPVEHFAALVRALPHPVLLLGSGKDAPVCEAIVAQSGTPRCVSLAGRTTLTQALALIAASRAMVSNDSGLMHVAAALDVPQVALFGSSSPHHTPPLNPHAQVLWLKNDPGYQPPLDCAPCFARECPLGHLRCLRDLTPAMALSKLEQYL